MHTLAVATPQSPESRDYPFATPGEEIPFAGRRLYSLAEFCADMGESSVSPQFRRMVLSRILVEEVNPGIIFLKRVTRCRTPTDLSRMIGFKTMPLPAIVALLEHYRKQEIREPPLSIIVLVEEERRATPIPLVFRETRVEGERFFAPDEWRGDVPPGHRLAWFSEA